LPSLSRLIKGSGKHIAREFRDMLYTPKIKLRESELQFLVLSWWLVSSTEQGSVVTDYNRTMSSPQPPMTV